MYIGQALSVQELIELLNQVEDKNLPVFVFDMGEIEPVITIDTSLEDRVDLMLTN